MEKFTQLTGIAAPMPLVNIDTDMIIPKQFLKTIKRSGLGANLFDEMRFDRQGNEVEDFVLNQPQYREAQILVAGDNFGCGSSREHAPWALLDFGIRCVISTSFADIFYNNCFKNGVLPIKVSREDLEKLFDDAERGANATLSIDLETSPDASEIYAIALVGDGADEGVSAGRQSKRLCGGSHYASRFASSSSSLFYFQLEIDREIER